MSTFALIGLLLTLRTQQEQIRTQENTSQTNDILVRQQQFQDQLFRAVDAYRDQLHSVSAQHGTNIGQFTGRVALREIWRRQFVAKIDFASSPLLKAVIESQLDAYSNELSGTWNSHREVSLAIEKILSNVENDQQVRNSVLCQIGDAWKTASLANRYQLDSLYRAWYTVYRILDTAPAYGISPEMIKIYSAAFRAQVSWIEMAFLLANQSGLPGNPSYPKACRHSLRYIVFDNLDRTHDAVVAIISHIVCGATEPSTTLGEAKLSALAFGPTPLQPSRSAA